MQDFGLWFFMGLKHITDLEGYDHILFLLALCVPYSWEQRVTLFWLVTAFTLGHSLSLALSTLGIVRVSSVWVELLIAISILLMAMQNLFVFGKSTQPNIRFQFLLTGGFGLIHGLGFSTLLRSMLGSQQTVAGPLFAFNLGLEAGQVFILMILFAVGLLIRKYFPNKQRIQAQLFSVLAIAFSLILIFQRFPLLLNT